MDAPAPAPNAMDIHVANQSPKLKKKPTKFQPGHCIEYGLEVCQRDPKTSQVIGVQCLFCIYIGKEDNRGQAAKRQRTANIMIWDIFRPELYKSHHMKQHTSSWIDYQLLSKAQKPPYFDRHKTVSLHTFMPKVKDAMLFSISGSIVENLIGDVFFHPDDDVEGDGPAITKANAMKLFRVQDDGSYQVEIKNELRFNLAMDYVSVGLSFRQTASAISMTQIRLRNPLLVGLNDHMVGQFARIIVGAALQDFANLLSNKRIWAFALAFDSSTHQGISFLMYVFACQFEATYTICIWLPCPTLIDTQL